MRDAALRACRVHRAARYSTTAKERTVVELGNDWEAAHAGTSVCPLVLHVVNRVACARLRRRRWWRDHHEQRELVSCSRPRERAFDHATYAEFRSALGWDASQDCGRGL